MSEEDLKRVLNASLEEVAMLRRMLTKYEIENDELKNKIKELEKKVK